MKPVGQNLTLAKVSLACVRREGGGGCQVLQFGKQTSDEYSNIKGEVENLFSISRQGCKYLLCVKTQNKTHALPVSLKKPD